MCIVRGEPEDGLQVVGVISLGGGARTGGSLAATAPIGAHDRRRVGGGDIGAAASPSDVGSEEASRSVDAGCAAGWVAGQHRRFDRFRFEYNFVRPHEALGQRPPAAVYGPSPRPYPERLLEPIYGDDQPVRRVSTRGTIMWRQHRIYVGSALVGEPEGVVELASGDWLVRFFDLDLGVIDPATRTLRAPPCKPRKPLRRRSHRRRRKGLMDNASPLPTTPQPQQPQT